MSSVSGPETREQSPETAAIQLPAPVTPPESAWKEGDTVPRAFVVAASGFLLALAFLLASSPVRNTDFWLHLADGKRIAEGTLPSGTDPSCYAAAEDGWTHRSWLFDVVLFHLFKLLGGAGLAFLKALTAAGLAAVMVLSGKKGNAWGVSLACTALVFLALTPWLALRPVLLSYLFLALTFWVLERQRNENAPAALQRYWPIPVLFAAWVNIDAWFFLGPLMVGCYFLGGLLSRPTQAAAGGMAENISGNKRATAWILGSTFLLGLGACLFNPSFVRVFAIAEPLGLSETAVRLQGDPLLRRPYALVENYYFPAGISVPGMAFWLLVGLGLASFAVLWRTRPWERLLSWMSLFLLCLFIRQAVPFFCIAAGPIMAMNWSAFRQRPITSLTRALSGWNALGRSLVLLALFLLVAVAWSGWLQNDPGPRRWSIEMEPSLAEAGKQLASWRDDGILQPEHHGFHFSPEAANVFAWLCPEEKSFVNAHRSVSASIAADYITVRNGLLGQPNDWRSILRRQRVSHVVLYNNVQKISEKAIHLLMETPEEWQLVYQRGRVAIFAWRESVVSKASAPPVFQPFHAAQLAFSLKSADRAPNIEPDDPSPAPFHWWDAWWRDRPVRSLDVDEAHQELTLFHAARPGDFRKAQKAWLPAATARAAGIIGVAGSPLSTGPRCIVNLVGPELLFPVMIQEQLFFSRRDLGPPAHLYLAIRAARRAIKDNPHSAPAYWALGDAYFSLARFSREATYQFPLLVHTRSIQAITAYQQALLLKPNLEIPRRNLIDLYQKMGYLDLMLQQLKEFHKRNPRLSFEGEEQRRKEMAAFAKAVRELEDKFALKSGDMKLVDRARLANKMGLADTALKILLASDVSAFGGAGLELELRLLLETGKAKQVRDWLEASHENQLGTSLYYLVRAKQAAADGDYRRADRDLQATVLRISDLAEQPLSLRDGGALMVGNAVLCGAAGGPLTKFSNEFLRLAPLKKKTTLLPDEVHFARYLWELNFKVAEEAKINVLRGLLALEVGEIARARRLFLAASRYWHSQGGMVYPDPESQSCRLIAQQWLQLIDTVSQPKEETHQP